MTTLIFAGTLVAFWGFLFFGRKLEFATGYKEGVWVFFSWAVIMALTFAIIWYCFNPVLPVLGKMPVLELSLVFANLAGAMSVFAPSTQWWRNADPAVRALRSSHVGQEEQSTSAAQASGEESAHDSQAGHQGLGEREEAEAEAEVLS